MQARITTLFIDDGGVMNDNARRGPEWSRLLAEFFVPRLGGSRAAWEAANRDIDRLIQGVLTPSAGGQDYLAWYDAYLVRWLKEMAAVVGVATPADDARCLELSCEARDYITERVRSAYPGAVEAIGALREMGFRLFTASGTHSRELGGYLRGMGIHQHFEALYGPDLVNRGKDTIDYYRRVFAHSGVAPEQSLVVDDNPQNLAWAGSLGAATCLVSQSPPPRVEATFIVSSLSDLPAALGK
ncbi:MAG: hypothetical protein A2Z28_02000 [Chloroflexi bacterium RBG_16_51_9]|nr:MAG: hypothetical protein A2Z28_02000 [Chloroflexi bacterium RBG_16_51_9]